MRVRALIVGVAVLTACLAAFAHADVIVFHDGSRVEGTISNHEVVAADPLGQSHIGFLADEDPNPDLSKIPVADINYVILIDAQGWRRVIEFGAPGAPGAELLAAVEPNLSVGVKVSHTAFSPQQIFEDVELDLDLSIVHIGLSLLGTSAPGPRIRFVAGGGFGLYRAKATLKGDIRDLGSGVVETFNLDETTNDLGFDLGIGVLIYTKPRAPAIRFMGSMQTLFDKEKGRRGVLRPHPQLSPEYEPRRSAGLQLGRSPSRPGIRESRISRTGFRAQSRVASLRSLGTNSGRCHALGDGRRGGAGNDRFVGRRGHG